MSAGQPDRAQSGAISSSALRTLRVNAVFHDVQEQHTDAIAAELIGRAHELANLPEHECDVDVRVEVVPSRDDDARDSSPR